MKILIVEDEKNQRELLRNLLEEQSYSVDEAKEGKTAISKFNKKNFDAVLLDRRLPDMEGIEVLRKIKKIDPVIPIIIITAFANIENAVKSIKEGAYHYLTKPIEPEELLVILKKAEENLSLKRENIKLKETLKEQYKYEKIIYASDEMEEVMSMVFRAAKSDTSVLITGESGTGKELVAGAIHDLSGRNKANFVIAHLAALPENLIESELFGHEKGAFTGAEKRRIGKFEYASGGTLFLDEIGDLPKSIQAKLLRVIQEQKIVRLGSNKEISIDVRLVSATNKNLEEEIEKNNFREDLYYRLNVINIKIPPLRKRKKDISPLVNHFVDIHSSREGKEIKGFTEEAMHTLLKYNFPGNIRELENIVKRVIVFSRNEYITKEDLPSLKKQKPSGISGGKLEESVSNLERTLILEALKKHKGNQTKAARDLGISERVIRYKMKKYGIG